MLAQAVVCAGAILGSGIHSAAVHWLSETTSAWERWVLESASQAISTQCSVLSTQNRVRPSDSAYDLTHRYEQFLHSHAPLIRKRHGVFFTPRPIADYIVAEIDRALQADLGLHHGLASQSAIRHPQSTIQFLDPACGTGVFLLAVIDHLHRRLGKRWNDFVPDLLPRLVGIDLLPVPAFLAKLNIALKLAETGYDFRSPGKINVILGDALSPNLQSAICNLQFAIPVLLGNPPFSSLSTNTNPWIARLVRGVRETRGYVQAGDERLGERKTWLHDDYVKFIRLAQWHVEQTGRGVVGLVTNHGYLDNATFRLMRQELMRVFPHIRVVDLHGNRKKDEVAPDGRRDENVFGLDQGTAISILARGVTRSVSEGAAGRVEYSEIWGSRDEKLRALDTPSLTRRVTRISPQAPHWRFVPTAAGHDPEYAAAWSLAAAMPVNTTAPVTARDHFVVAFNREELCQRIAEFRDLSIPDAEIRRRYFRRTRSARYETGDTRGWKLPEARRIVAADNDWRQHIRRCLYRPFDWRFVFWHPAMIDWPRNEITRHLVGEGCEMAPRQRDGEIARQRDDESPSRLLAVSPSRRLVLIARRQQLPTQPCTYFWIADGLALDGVIRSDNRGSESLFPLWTVEADGSERANFAPAFVGEVAECIGSEPPAERLLGFVYALFHSLTYRQRYAPALRTDFPRVLMPAAGGLFHELADLGQRLIELHMLRAVSPNNESSPQSADFRVGGYVALKKWLQPKHRCTGDPEYQQIAAAIDETIRIMAEIDAAIGRHGGFPAAFADPVTRPLRLPLSTAHR